MQINNIFNLDDVLEMERDAIREMQVPISSTSYYKEEVAIYLFDKWRNDPDDTRILLYSFPLIKSLMIKHIKMLSSIRMESEEIFNILVIGLANALTKYTINRGRIFTYSTLLTTYRIYDLVSAQNKNHNHLALEDWDAEINDDAVHELEDFILFLKKLKDNEGHTTNKIIDALITILTSNVINVQDRKAIYITLSRITKLPDLLIIPAYNRIISQYIHSIID